LALADLGHRCSCPSRKFPCKHVLALAWAYSEHPEDFAATSPPDWVRDRLGRRRGSAAAPVCLEAPQAGAPIDRAGEAPATEEEPPDPQAEARAAQPYSSIFAAVMASIPAVRTRLVVFDTAVLDLTEELADPVEVLFGVQLGGGTDINQALAYCQGWLREPAMTHLVLITDLYEGGDAALMLERAGALVRGGIQLIVLLALTDDGKPVSNEENGRKMAALGCPVFACTPDLFPEADGGGTEARGPPCLGCRRDIATMRA